MRTAQIVVRKQNIGALYSDMGFQRQQNGAYNMIHDELDGNNIMRKFNPQAGYNEKFNTHFANGYAHNKVKQYAFRKGYRVKKQESQKNQIRLRLMRIGGR